MQFTTVTAFHRLRMMGLAEALDVWRRGNAVVAVPRAGHSEAEIAAAITPAGAPAPADPSAAISEFFARSFAGSNLSYSPATDVPEHRPAETAPWS